MAAKKVSESGGVAPASGAKSTPNRRARFGADAHGASRARTAATRRAVDASASASTHADSGSVVAKSTAGIVQARHEQHPGFQAHRKGHPADQEVKSLAHIYTPWANVRVNGSGILAIAAWSKRLQEEGKDAVRAAGKSFQPFIRGLIHR